MKAQELIKVSLSDNEAQKLSSSLDCVLYPSCSCHQSLTSRRTLETLGIAVLLAEMSRVTRLGSGPSVKWGKLFLLPAAMRNQSTYCTS
jgi:hypothetical protein